MTNVPSLCSHHVLRLPDKNADTHYSLWITSGYKGCRGGVLGTGSTSRLVNIILLARTKGAYLERSETKQKKCHAKNHIFTGEKIPHKIPLTDASITLER